MSKTREMKETITAIEEVFNIAVTKSTRGEGFSITTTKQKITLLISNEQACCEKWGYISSEDDYSDFIGAELLSIATVDEDFNPKILDRLEKEYVHTNSCLFINIETSKGTLQFVLYNEHNGYYGHDVYVISNQLTTYEEL